MIQTRRVDRPPLVDRGEVDLPGPRVHRELLVPGPRFPVALGLVDHDVDLGEQLDDVAVGVAVVGEQVVARPVAPRPPVQPVAVLGEVVEHRDQVVGAAHLVGDVVHAGVLLAGHEVGRVVVGVAAHEDEEVADGVRPPEPEEVLVEGLHGRQLGGVGRDVAELGGAQGREALDAARVLRGRQVQRDPGHRLLQHQDVGRARPDVAAPLGDVPGVLEPLLGAVQVLPELVADHLAGLGVALR